MDAVTVIEGMVMAHHYHDQTLLDRWRRARRIPARVGRPRERRRQTERSTDAAAAAS